MVQGNSLRDVFRIKYRERNTKKEISLHYPVLVRPKRIGWRSPAKRHTRRTVESVPGNLAVRHFKQYSGCSVYLPEL